MTGPEKHVLLWVAPEFLQSTGVIQILEQVGALGRSAGEVDELMEAATRSGGFAISGVLMDSNHGAGIWIAPGVSKSLQLMVPWGFVRCTVVAETPQSSKIFSMAADLAAPPRGPARGT